MQHLFFQHIERLQAVAEEQIEKHSYDGLLIGSGQLHRRFLDDNNYPFRANPHFLHWVPFLEQSPHCWVLIKPGSKPQLHYHMPSDFWHMVPELPDKWWSNAFEVIAFTDRPAINQKRLAVMAETMPDYVHESWQHNPELLLHDLHLNRRIKSDWESHCLREANKIAVKGHIVAEQQFLAGASEYQIHQTYLSAIEHNERDMPYDNIVGLNEHAAVLHYQFQQRQVPDQHRSLLIDAGACFLGYAADITRTFTPSGSVFSELVAGLNQAQQQLNSEVAAGVDFVSLHCRMHYLLAELLQRSGLVQADPQQQVDSGITRAFFPHGLGHLLGLQVHDVGSWQHDTLGVEPKPPTEHPFLRLTGKLQPGYVITIEPGLYFIDSLLTPLRNSATGKLINWTLVDELAPYGGIRIEDNILITGNGIENLTRDAFVGYGRSGI
ncbi:Xaa-Pro dipeptidase [Amphritea balenae]|uniref:Xaa-Pro dipeptidase n=1 Tax=Amphritea balenae TaxID=452629 RepID=A0A3P1SNK3_9GAMM|nr:Xaa-Pro dipeptidase [Amphritea balenae]RRC98235.1 Xaa-Pro dipeptidase [Amphritea balenae]GGK80302.1 Xaa-Pro dipeptidase [Amphritea balenae]